MSPKKGIQPLVQDEGFNAFFDVFIN